MNIAFNSAYKKACSILACILCCFLSVCAPWSLGPWGRLEVPGYYCHAGAEEEGEGQASLFHEEDPDQADAAGDQERGKQDRKIHGRSQTIWSPCLSCVHLANKDRQLFITFLRLVIHTGIVLKWQFWIEYLCNFTCSSHSYRDWCSGLKFIALYRELKRNKMTRYLYVTI